MPIYDYKCKYCGHVLENELQDPGGWCPKCDRDGLERLFPSAPPTPHFRHGGFYSTDYKPRNVSKPGGE